jgi:MSHA pilin protein MshC
VNGAVKRAAGFTMVELIVVMILVGIVAAVAAPRLMGGNFLTAVSLRDQIQAALRSAQKTAVARRRVVCAVQPNDYSPPAFSIAREAGAASCTIAIPNAIDISGLGSTPLRTFNENLPTSVFFQPDGSITSDMAGINPVSGTINFSYETATYTIRLDGVTGYVE